MPWYLRFSSVVTGIKMTLHRIFSYAKLSGASLTTLHRVLTCAMLSQKYSGKIEQDFFLRNVVWTLLDSIAQDFDLFNVDPRVFRKHCTGVFLCNVVWSLSDNIAQSFALYILVQRVLRQQWTGTSLIRLIKFVNNFVKKRHQYRCFHVKFAKF